MAQGPNRLQRGLAYFERINQTFQTNHQLLRVPDCGQLVDHRGEEDVLSRHTLGERLPDELLCMTVTVRVSRIPMPDALPMRFDPCAASPNGTQAHTTPRILLRAKPGDAPRRNAAVISMARHTPTAATKQSGAMIS